MDHAEMSHPNDDPHDQKKDRPWVLVVDDEPGVLMILERLLCHERYRIQTARSAMEAVAHMREREFAVVLTDQMMPAMTGIELLTIVRQQSPTTVCIMMTATTDIKVAEEVVNQNLAHFFVTKPWRSGRLQELVLRALEEHRRRVRDPGPSFGETDTSYIQDHATRAAFSLARAVDARDKHTHRHSERVSAFGVLLGQAMRLDTQVIEEIRIGGLLHDLGKIGIPDEVLLKAGRLNDDEFRYIRMHPVIGVTITEPIHFPWGIDAIVRQHHENHDGSGYPMGLGEEDISLSARVIHVVDAYEAMASDRVYRKALSNERIEQEFTRHRGTQFDPDITDTFLDQLHHDAFADA